MKHVDCEGRVVKANDLVEIVTEAPSQGNAALRKGFKYKVWTITEDPLFIGSPEKRIWLKSKNGARRYYAALASCDVRLIEEASDTDD